MLAIQQRVLICVLAGTLVAHSAPAVEFQAVFVVEPDKADVVTLAGADRAESPPAGSMLYLRDGDYFNGAIEDCDTPNVVRWRVPGIAAPLEFPAEPFRAAYFAASNEHPAPAGEYCFELSDGDLLYGSLTAVTPNGLEIEAAPFGRLHVARSAIRRFTSWVGNSTTEYRGPNGLAEWRQSGNDKWREEAGRLIATAVGAEVQKELSIPSQARFEFEISWSSIPEFTLVLATGASDEQLQEGYRFEVWDRTLVVVRACGQSADVATICELNTLTDRVHLEAFYDQVSGKLSIHALDGTQLAEITLAEKSDQPQPLRLVSLTNRGSDVRLEFLAVGPWNGQLPTPVEADKQRIRLTDGTILYGEITGYHSDTKQFVLQTEPEEKSDSEGEPDSEGSVEEKLIDTAQVSCVTLTPAAASDKCLFRLGLQDGSRFSGALAKVADGKLYLTRPGIDEPLACPITSVRSLAGIAPDYHAPDAKERVGRLEMEGLRSHGWLAEAAAATASTTPNVSCLVWQPRYSTSASPLQIGASGRIVYREPPAPPKQPTAEEIRVQRQMRRVQQPPQPAVGVAGAILRVITGDQPERQPRPKRNGAGTLYLVGGDRIPCETQEIDEEGVHFTSSVVVANFLPHREVKALELVPNWTAAALAEEKRQRLLTLPRMQKPNPPTHLIASTSGDFLRARLTAMTADTLTLETRLESKKIPRNRVACLIWLHETDDPASTHDGEHDDVVDDSAESLKVQAIKADGVRLTFVPEECAHSILAGMSERLGACKVDLATVDALVFGDAIQAAATEQTYGAWKLTDAPEPRYIRDAAAGGTGERPGGTESGLVGKAAPDFNLDLVDGGHFSLAEQKGRIVFLDFWASWCGPCMQALPTVDAVVEEFARDKVRLIAVNLQEDRAAAASALERLKIHPQVALDVDGASAEKYQVTAIPQTVVIDSEGHVAHVFVGANSDFAAQLRAAIQNLITPPAQ